jgi:hypothetical protein
VLTADPLGEMELPRITTAGAVAAIALTALTPAAAGAASAPRPQSLAGTVVATDGGRRTVTTADRNGVVRTVRIKRGASRYAAGQRIVVRATQRGDGTWTALGVKRAGRATRARVRAAVVQRRGAVYLVSAGGSTFSLRSKDASARPGDVVVADVTLGRGAPASDRLRRTGVTRAVEVEGAVTRAGDGRFDVEAEKGRRVTIVVPAAIAVTVAAGDHVEALAAIAQDGSLTLVALEGDDHADHPEHGIQFDAGDGEADVRGVITAMTTRAITVSAGASETTFTCAVRPGTSLAQFALGDEVEMGCELGNGTFTLTRLRSDRAELDQSV